MIVTPWSQENVHQSADKELTLEMSALETTYVSQITLSTQLIKSNNIRFLSQALSEKILYLELDMRIELLSVRDWLMVDQ